MKDAGFTGDFARGTGVAVPVSNWTRSSGGRINGLDGLRAIAVTAVLLFHADIYWARGGYLGVDLFFVLSGFLITGLLADEIQDSGRLDFRKFYWRRAKRLLPAAWLMMASVTVVAAWIAVDAMPQLRRDVLTSLAYMTNWGLLSVNASYFESTGRPPLLQHLWSLAIEEQFYIAWAVVVPLGLRFMTRRSLAVVTMLLVMTSAAWMAVLASKIGYPGNGDPSRLYFGTDTHGFPLLLGAALGLAWQPGRATWLIHPVLRALGFLFGLLALVSMLALFVFLGEETAWLYPWGFLLAATVSIVLIATASHPALAFGRWLDCRPLRWIGNRSYGIYLWHWPVFMLTRPGIDLPSMDENAVLALRLILTIGIAAISYRYVEMPIRHGALERAWRDWRVATTRRNASLRATPIAVVSLLVFGVTGSLLWYSPIRSEPARDVSEVLSLESTGRFRDVGDEVQGAVTASEGAALVPVEVPVEIVRPDLPPVETFKGHELTAVGDSVLLGSSQLLKITLGGVDVHATMGWQAADFLSQLLALRKAGTLRSVALVHLGTNGYVYEDQLRQILSTLEDCKRVILVNTHVPRRWMEFNNVLFERVAPDFPNVAIARWNDVSEGEPDYFISDGIHLTDRGQRAFIANIMRVGNLRSDDAHTADPASIDPTKDYSTGAGDLSPTLVLASRPAPSDRYWQKMARCETDGNWQHVGSNSGGLSISVEDWKTWGGLEFAQTPAGATKGQQIEVANRLSTQGWVQPTGTVVRPIGFARWRCVVALPPPSSHPGSGTSLTYTPESVIAQTFHLGKRGEVVRDLQTILGARRDGIYERGTRRRHLAYLKKNGLPEALAGDDT